MSDLGLCLVQPRHKELYCKGLRIIPGCAPMDPFPKEKLQSGFSLDRLRSLLAVYEAGYIARASGNDRTRAHLISRQISELEAFFGTALRRKEGRQAVLSSTGEKLALIIKDFYRTIQSFQDEVEGLQTIELGTGNSIIETMLIPRINELRQASSDSELMLRNRRSGEIVEQLLSGDLDLGIIPASKLAGKLVTKPLGKVIYELYVPMGLTGRILPRDPFEVIQKYPYASIDGSGEIRTAIQNEGRSKGVLIRPQLECSGYSMVASAVLGGDFCGILPSYCRNRFEEQNFQRMKMPGLHKLERKYVAAWLPSAMRVKEKALTGAVDYIQGLFEEITQTAH